MGSIFEKYTGQFFGKIYGTFTYIWLKSMVHVGKYLAILLVTFLGWWFVTLSKVVGDFESPWRLRFDKKTLQIIFGMDVLSDVYRFFHVHPLFGKKHIPFDNDLSFNEV